MLALAALLAAASAAAEPIRSPDDAPSHGAAATVGVSVTITALRSTKGRVLACLTMRGDTFPECAKDPQARLATVPAGATAELHFDAVPPGRYAISAFHDENGNGKLDKQLILPREGYAFSRDAPVRFGPPSFASAAFPVGTDSLHQTIRMRYLF